MIRKLLLPIISLLLALCFAVPALAAGDLEFDKTVTWLFEGQTLETVLYRTGDAAEGEVTYTTSAPKVATVDENGVVTGLQKGTATITAKVGSEKATIKLTVYRGVTSLTVDESSLIVFEAEHPALEGIIHVEPPVLDENGQPVEDEEPELPVLIVRRGKSVTIKTKIEPSDVSSKKVTITSSDEDIIRVSESKLTGRELGECEVTIASQLNPEFSVTYRVLVVEPVTSVKVTSEAEYVHVGGSIELAATVKPVEATLQNVVWTSSKESVATVDEYGVVTGISKGTATITAWAMDGSGKSDTYRVSVYQQVNDIVLEDSELTINVGSSKTLKATVYPSDANNKKVTWTSSNEAIAKVNKEGKVTPVAPGVCTITCTSQDMNDVFAVCQVTVQQPVTKVAFDGSKATVSKGETLQLYWTTSPDYATDDTVMFYSDKESVATIDEFGVVTGISKGTATITVMAMDGSKKKDTIQVTVTQPVEDMILDLTEVTVNVGSTQRLSETILPSNANNKDVTWVSSNENIAKVSSSGKITPVAPGVCTITAISNDNPDVTATCVATILQPVTKVKFYDDTLELDINTTAQLYWTTEPYNASNPSVTFSSDKESVATVDENGLVYGVKRGTATITVMAADGSKKKDTIQVNVLQPVEGVYMEETEMRVGVGETIRGQAILVPSDASNTNMSWGSNDSKIATVSGSSTRPRVTGIRWGTAVITGVTEDGGYATYFIVDVGDYNYALRISDLYVQENQLKINTYNESNMTITRFNLKIEVYDIYGQPLPCTNVGNHAFIAGNSYTLAEGETSRRGSYYFYDYVQPTATIGHVVAYVTDYETADGLFHIVEQDKIEKIEYFSPMYIGPEGLAPSVTPAPPVAG